ncbi:MAG: sigma-70 family RNA polymerase sigma factor [Verrucomicrobiae bacterium]|nr:sigma-70 family RNA polymerase sigma factor [Verrucomicrobiae bacterium]
MTDSATENDDAFVSLLTEHQLAIRCYVSSLLPGDSGSPDVLQQANITLWKKRSDFEIGTNFKAWAFAVARFEVLNYRKRQARDSRLLFSDELEEIVAAEMETQVDDFEERRLLLQGCLLKLRPKDRELIHRRYFSAKTLKDFADETGRSHGGLKVTLHRLRNVLKRCIETQLTPREEVAN